MPPKGWKKAKPIPERETAIRAQVVLPTGPGEVVVHLLPLVTDEALVQMVSQSGLPKEQARELIEAARALRK